MAVRFYDSALVEKIKKWTRDPNLQILKPDETTRLLQITADKNNDKPVKLPIIAISNALANIPINITTYPSLELKFTNGTILCLIFKKV